MSIIRCEHKYNFTIADNGFIKDPKLSAKAKGVMIYMLSLPKSWDFSLRELATHFRDGKDAINNALKELEGCGYLEKKLDRDEEGRFQRTHYIVHEQSIKESGSSDPAVSKPAMVNPLMDIQTQISINKTKEEKNKAAETLTRGEMGDQKGKSAAAFPLTGFTSLAFEASISNSLTNSQGEEIKRRVGRLLKLNPELDVQRLCADIEKTLLDTSCFSMCGNDFSRKLNTILKANREGRWMGYAEKRGSAQEVKLTPEEAQLKELNSELNHVKAEIQSLQLGKRGVLGKDPVFVRSLDESIARLRVRASAIREKICSVDAAEVSLAC